MFEKLLKEDRLNKKQYIEYFCIVDLYLLIWEDVYDIWINEKDSY